MASFPQLSKGNAGLSFQSRVLSAPSPDSTRLPSQGAVPLHSAGLLETASLWLRIPALLYDQILLFKGLVVVVFQVSHRHFGFSRISWVSLLFLQIPCRHYTYSSNLGNSCSMN